jgi:plasmid stabilization system protein ParE
MYEAAPHYGQGVRRISLAGQHVLYEVDEATQAVLVLAVVGQRQNPGLLK